MIELSDFSKPIRDPIWKHIWMNDELYAVTKTDSFMRLYNVKQLGPTELVYPGAGHTRAVHSIGVYFVKKGGGFLGFKRGLYVLFSGSPTP